MNSHRFRRELWLSIVVWSFGLRLVLCCPDARGDEIYSTEGSGSEKPYKSEVTVTTQEHAGKCHSVIFWIVDGDKGLRREFSLARIGHFRVVSSTDAERQGILDRWAHSNGPAHMRKRDGTALELQVLMLTQIVPPSSSCRSENPHITSIDGQLPYEAPSDRNVLRLSTSEGAKVLALSELSKLAIESPRALTVTTRSGTSTKGALASQDSVGQNARPTLAGLRITEGREHASVSEVLLPLADLKQVSFP